MSAFLKNRGFRNCGANGQPRAHYNLPFRIQDWTKELCECDCSGECGHCGDDIRVDLVINDDIKLSHYLIYRSDENEDGDVTGYSDAYRVMVSEGRKLFDACIDFVMKQPINPDSNIYGSGDEKGYRAMASASFGVSFTGTE
jgi:hypothetical protein